MHEIEWERFTISSKERCVYLNLNVDNIPEQGWGVVWIKEWGSARMQKQKKDIMQCFFKLELECLTRNCNNTLSTPDESAKATRENFPTKITSAHSQHYAKSNRFQSVFLSPLSTASMRDTQFSTPLTE